MSVNITQTNIFDLICQSISNKIGYTVVQCMKEEDSKIIHYDTKEEFEKYFSMKKHPYYPSKMLVPNIITQKYGDSCDCFVDDNIEEYLDLNNLYLFIDGKISR